MRRLPLLMAMLLSSCNDNTIGTNNSEPEASILEPAPDQEFEAGDAVLFRGTVEDRGTAAAELSVSWSSSLDGVLDEGPADSSGETTFSSADLRAGEHTITLRAVDAQGASGVDALSITVAAPTVENTNPTCQITAPLDDSEVAADQTVMFEGSAEDAQSDPIELTATWTSSEDGLLGEGTPSSSGALALTVDDLSPATHIITLDVADPDGGNCSEFIVVRVLSGNQRPSIAVPTISPELLFTDGTASCATPTPVDPENDPTTVTLRWLIDDVDTGVTTPTLAGSWFDKGDNLSCEATPADLEGPGAPALSPKVTVSDSPPTQPVVAITPSAPDAGTQALLCSVTTASLDADADPITYTFAWTLDSAPWTGATSQTTHPGDTIAASDVAAGTWQCTVTPTAAGLPGAAGSTSTTVGTVTTGTRVFVTSVGHDGDFGGITGADAHCQTRANAAGLGGTWLAWLSGASVSSSPSVRFNHSADAYVRLDGAVVADDWADLTDGAIANAINVDEFGATQTTGQIFSFTRIDGTPGLFGSATSDCYGGDCHCNNWTTNAGQGTPTPGSAVARRGFTDDDWTDYSFGNFCNLVARLYCFEQ
jgi:hypothetical protein